MTLYFDGKDYAQKKELELKEKVNVLREKGVVPKLISIIVGDDPASKLYVGLKKRVGESIGIEVIVISLGSNTSKKEVIRKIWSLNEDSSVNGIMIQLPLPEYFSGKDKSEIINTILPSKDVDGLREDSPYIHPTSKAILDVLDYAMDLIPLKTRSLKVCVVGSSGMVGRPLVKELRNYKYEIIETDSETKDLKSVTKKADILISCCGVPGIIEKDMVKENAILIDVGAPVGDIEKDAYEKASFISPVPGGIGPVTIACLMENLINSFEFKNKLD